MSESSPTFDRYDLVQALLEDLAERRARGEELSLEQVLSAHPELEPELRELWSACGEIEQGFSDQAERVRRALAEAQQILDAVSGSHGFSKRYEIEAEIGKGGMGVVLRVRDKQLDRQLAMKVILDQVDATQSGKSQPVAPHQLVRFLNEAKITGQLDHPGIVPVHEVGVDAEGRAYFTMKLVRGRTLAEVFERQVQGDPEFTRPRVLSLLQRVCEAMAFAHKRGVIHRDLKPANVMIGDFGEVYVMDWGLARRLDDVPETQDDSESERSDPLIEHMTRTRAGQVVGTPAYMSPEQAEGRLAELGPASDVYALGAMLYQLIAGHAPYCKLREKAPGGAVLLRIVNGPPEPLTQRDTPPELIAVCRKAMQRDPEHRYQTMSELAADLGAFLEGRVVRAYETGTWAETRKWVQRNRGLAVALAGVVLSVAVGAVSFAIKSHHATDAARLAQREAQRADNKAAEAAANAATAQRLANAEAAARQEAQDNATRASEQEHIATQHANDLLSLSAQEDLEDLIARASQLWPAHPDMVEKYEAWLRNAGELVNGRPADIKRGLKARPSLAQHRAKLADIQSQATSQSTDPERAADDQRTWEFVNPDASWWHSQLSSLVAGLDALVDAEHGLMGDTVAEPNGWGIRKRYEFARTIRERSIDSSDAASRWDEAIDAIASSPAYGGLHLAPQVGLIPIGADPDSGLWEFAHLQTGDPPIRGADNKLLVTEQMGLVFVLIPGGTYWMGAQNTDQVGRHFDPAAQSFEAPVHEVRVKPFLISKFEMTQGQWLRITGSNPSVHGTSFHVNGYAHDLRHPVEQVSWAACAETMSRLGLRLPSEAQWEIACRAGTDTPWWTGTDRDSLKGKVNIADRTAQNAGATWDDLKDWPEYQDGWVVHAPVGQFPANPFGLHEVHGNVWEWCEDSYHRTYDGAPTDGSSWVSPGLEAAYVLRGGSFDFMASRARSAFRYGYHADDKWSYVGVRPARFITP